MRKDLIIGALALSLLATSCATIISGTTKNITISSNPPSATVYVDDVEVGKTPYEATLERKDEHSVKIKLNGYQTYETQLTHTLNPWTIANIAIGGVIGIVVDASTGAIYDFAPKAISADLSNGTAMAPMVAPVARPEVATVNNTTEQTPSNNQFKVGQTVKFYNYRLNSKVKGVIKEIKDKTVLVEYESFGIFKKVEVSKADIIK